MASSLGRLIKGRAVQSKQSLDNHLTLLGVIIILNDGDIGLDLPTFWAICLS